MKMNPRNRRQAQYIEDPTDAVSAVGAIPISDEIEPQTPATHAVQTEAPAQQPRVADQPLFPSDDAMQGDRHPADTAPQTVTADVALREELRLLREENERLKLAPQTDTRRLSAEELEELDSLREARVAAERRDRFATLETVDSDIAEELYDRVLRPELDRERASLAKKQKELEDYLNSMREESTLAKRKSAAYSQIHAKIPNIEIISKDPEFERSEYFAAARDAFERADANAVINLVQEFEQTRKRIVAPREVQHTAAASHPSGNIGKPTFTQSDYDMKRTQYLRRQISKEDYQKFQVEYAIAEEEGRVN